MSTRPPIIRKGIARQVLPSCPVFVLLAIHEQLHVDIPETDCGRLVTLNDLVAYLSAKTGASPGAGRKPNPTSTPA